MSGRNWSHMRISCWPSSSVPPTSAEHQPCAPQVPSSAARSSSVFVTVVPISMGWRQFVPLEHYQTQALWLLYAIGIPFGAILALAGWRIARRFGWRGLAAFVIVASIVLPCPICSRPELSSAAHLGVVVPGTLPWIAYTLSWACALLLSHSIMRLMAGRAGDDRLARRRWILSGSRTSPM